MADKDVLTQEEIDALLSGVDDGSVIDAEICVIGAGAAGITLAREFIGTDARVCIIESGGLDFEENTQSLYAGKNTGRDYYQLDESRLRYFGGSTNHWGNWCAYQARGFGSGWTSK